MIDSDDEMVQQEAGRQAINSGVQEFGSTLGVMALGRIEKEIDPIYLAPVAFVHDAIYCYVPEEYAEWGAKTLKRYMESNPIEKWFGVRMKCPIVADVSFGRNLGDTYEMEGLNFQDDFDFSKVFEGVEDEGKIIHLPEQLVPPNYGRLDK
jgi:DNA polymerase I-like protein with 3'-5' exonuclease and polymerase domains